MEAKNNPELTPQRLSSRRSLIAKGGAALGACLVATPFSIARGQNAEKTNTSSPVVFDVKKYGATGLRKDNATKSFRDAIEACTTSGGGVVNVPAGEYTVGTVQLKDHVTLNIEAGATLFLSQDRNDFMRGGRAMIFAQDAKNIAVTGRGTLDGLARYDFLEMTGVDPEIAKEIEIARAAGIDMRRYYRSREAMNTFMFIINDSTDFLLSGVSIINSPLWTVRLNDCDRVNVRGVYIYSDLEKGVNADGIDICSSRNVTISDSVITTADDAIVLKAISRNDKKANPVENITVTNCVLSSSSTPLMIGTETEADIRHVVFNNCVIRNSNKGFGINVQDGATVSNVIFSNLTIETSRRHWNWWGDSEMCKFVLKKRKDSSRLGKIRDIIIDNIIGYPMGTSTITGHPEQPLENIRISNVQMYMTPENAKDKRSSHALKIENVNGLKIRDLSVAWNEEKPEEKWDSALVLKNVTDFVIDSFEGRQGLKKGNAPAILMENAAEGVVRESKATADTGTFIHVTGSGSRDIILRNNNVKKAQKEITFGDKSVSRAVTK
ncbi:MAG: glycosyl hydrolase family 28 protein [Bacteroidota bacterium]|nr:glycosyl hydrolase family 28 protein [Bacteroidota bacterium]